MERDKEDKSWMRKYNDAVNQYQNKLNEAVDDGSGCAETWEQLQNLRSEGGSLQTTRRNVLQAIGAGAVSLTGVSTASATGRTEHEKLGISLTEILASDQVQSILKQLDHPNPKSVDDDNFGEEGIVKINLDQAETDMVEEDDESIENSSKVIRTTAPTSAGNLLALQINDKIVAAFHEFDKNVGDDLKKKLGLAGEVGWPETTEAKLVGTETQAVFRREISEDEKSKILQEISGSIEIAGAFSQNGQSGYSAVKESADDDSIRYELESSFKVKTKEDFNIQEPTREIMAQGSNCDLLVAECLAQVLFPAPLGCGGCGWICVTPVPGAGQLACASCLLAVCGPIVLAYAACAGIQDCV